MALCQLLQCLWLESARPYPRELNRTPRHVGIPSGTGCAHHEEGRGPSSNPCLARIYGRTTAHLDLRRDPDPKLLDPCRVRHDSGLLNQNLRPHPAPWDESGATRLADGICVVGCRKCWLQEEPWSTFSICPLRTPKPVSQPLPACSLTSLALFSIIVRWRSVAMRVLLPARSSLGRVERRMKNRRRAAHHIPMRTPLGLVLNRVSDERSFARTLPPALRGSCKGL